MPKDFTELWCILRLVLIPCLAALHAPPDSGLAQVMATRAPPLHVQGQPTRALQAHALALLGIPEL